MGRETYIDYRLWRDGTMIDINDSLTPFPDGVSIRIPDKSIEYWKGGELHREDGPSLIERNGDQYWNINGIHHRDNGPATVRVDGDRFWFKNGKGHREDGPAIIRGDGTLEWKLFGQKLTEEQWIKRMTNEQKGRTL